MDSLIGQSDIDTQVSWDKSEGGIAWNEKWLYGECAFQIETFNDEELWRRQKRIDKREKKREWKVFINIISLFHLKSFFLNVVFLQGSLFAILRCSICITLCHFRPRENASSFTNLILCSLVQVLNYTVYPNLLTWSKEKMHPLQLP